MLRFVHPCVQLLPLQYLWLCPPLLLQRRDKLVCFLPLCQGSHHQHLQQLHKLFYTTFCERKCCSHMYYMGCQGWQTLKADLSYSSSKHRANVAMTGLQSLMLLLWGLGLLMEKCVLCFVWNSSHMLMLWCIASVLPFSVWLEWWTCRNALYGGGFMLCTKREDF